MSKTTILVETKTRDRLRNVGRKADTYDFIINRALDALEGKTKK